MSSVSVTPTPSMSTMPRGDSVMTAGSVGVVSGSESVSSGSIVFESDLLC